MWSFFFSFKCMYNGNKLINSVDVKYTKFSVRAKSTTELESSKKGINSLAIIVFRIDAHVTSVNRCLSIHTGLFGRFFLTTLAPEAGTTPETETACVKFNRKRHLAAALITLPHLNTYSQLYSLMTFV